MLVKEGLRTLGPGTNRSPKQVKSSGLEDVQGSFLGMAWTLAQLLCRRKSKQKRDLECLESIWSFRAWGVWDLAWKRLEHKEEVEARHDRWAELTVLVQRQGRPGLNHLQGLLSGVPKVCETTAFRAVVEGCGPSESLVHMLFAVQVRFSGLKLDLELKPGLRCTDLGCGFQGFRNSGPPKLGPKGWVGLLNTGAPTL